MQQSEGADNKKTINIRLAISAVIAFSWSIFQISIAKWILLDATWTKAIHLAFGIIIVYLNIPFLREKTHGRFPFLRKIGIIDIILGVLASCSALYIVYDYIGIAGRAGSPNTTDIVVGIILIVTLMEATRRTVGPALPVIVTLFILYAFLGPYLPDAFAFKGVSLSRFISQITMDTEGIYGVPLGVSASVVFLFVLFGTMLDKAGGGEYFIKVALSLLGAFKGGAAKAAVLGSALTGLISGSSIANVVTTGTFTIPLMKRLGYPAHKAAAIEVSASSNSQLAPPIMGAAAFIIAEYCNVPYIEVVKAAAIPAFAAYAGLFWITHVEASKLGMKGLPKSELPPLWGTLKQGLHFLIPIFFLLYELIVLARSPERAIFRAIMVLMFLMIVVDPLKAYFAKKPVVPVLKSSFINTLYSLSAGARNMCTVAMATASAGIIVGVVALGLGQQITHIVEVISGGNLFILIIITAIAGLLLGMGLPTTANYIIMASLTAPIMVQAGANLSYMGVSLAASLLVCHMYCFYFGILADVTPPVGLAAYAGAAIADTNPIKTGIQGFFYDIRTAILPLFFLFNHDIVLEGITSIPLAIFIFIMTCIGSMIFASFAQGWFIFKNTFFEAILMLAATAIMLFPALITLPLGIPYEMRHVGYAAGLALIGIIYMIQLSRKKKAERLIQTA